MGCHLLPLQEDERWWFWVSRVPQHLIKLISLWKCVSGFSGICSLVHGQGPFSWLCTWHRCSRTQIASLCSSMWTQLHHKIVKFLTSKEFDSGSGVNAVAKWQHFPDPTALHSLQSSGKLHPQTVTACFSPQLCSQARTMLFLQRLSVVFSLFLPSSYMQSWRCTGQEMQHWNCHYGDNMQEKCSPSVSPAARLLHKVFKVHRDLLGLESKWRQ